jgi:regulator of sigma E protease
LETLTTVWNITEVALGLGFVIFIHELGHFLLAKWNGVKVEKFSIGFGRTLVGFTRGETEYVLAVIPLGGFVKMLGEGPDEPANKSTDPRAYPNKSVGARMAIISAGVIMNVLFGMGCFVYPYLTGKKEVPAQIGLVIAGGAAYEAGLKGGDEIIAVDGRNQLSFDHLFLKIRLSGTGQVLRFDVKRPGLAHLLELDIEPRREAGQPMPSIGITPEESLELAPPPFDRPAGMVQSASAAAAGLSADDTLVALGPEGEPPVKVADAQDLHRQLARWIGRPLVFVFQRKTKAASASPGTESVTVTLPANNFVDLGLRMAIEPILGVQRGGPAERAGFRKGDRIVKVNDNENFDPMYLPTECAAAAGREMTFEVERREPGQEELRRVTLTATPDDSPAWIEPVLSTEPLDIPGLGLAYHVRAHVEEVADGSPAARAGLKRGDIINTLRFTGTRPGNEPEPAREKTAKEQAKEKEKEKEKKSDAATRPIEFKDDNPNWAHAFTRMQLEPLQEVQVTVNQSNRPITITPAVRDDWYHPLRGLQFQGLVRTLPPQTLGVALSRSSEDTIDNILSIYLMIRSMVEGRVSPKAVAGPLLIPKMLYDSAAAGWSYLIQLLGILSINLAVINFLPIPPLDGGQMAFLIAEKVRGRPLPDSAVIVGSWMGLLLVVALMVFVLYQDVTRLWPG